MSEPPPQLPPEVPEEFAAAYWVAYERAISAQSVPPRGKHRERSPHPAAEALSDQEFALPERTRPIVLGTHRTEGGEEAPSRYERARDSWWFVPLLLLLLATVLILAAYVGGRSFAHHVATSDVATRAVSSGLLP